MYRRFLLFIGFVVAVSLIASPPLVPIAAAAPPTPCFDVRVEFRGRTPTTNVGGVQFYLWTYRVYGNGCINRGFSHWTLGLCAGMEITGISSTGIDNSDPVNGTSTAYMPVRGPDPPTGLNGLKWNYVGGNQLDKANEYDEFSFIASGNIATVPWGAKGGALLLYGTTQGPTCAPVSTRSTTWGAMKTRFQ